MSLQDTLIDAAKRALLLSAPSLSFPLDLGERLAENIFKKKPSENIRPEGSAAFLNDEPVFWNNRTSRFIPAADYSILENKLPPGVASLDQLKRKAPSSNRGDIRDGNPGDWGTVSPPSTDFPSTPPAPVQLPKGNIPQTTDTPVSKAQSEVEKILGKAPELEMLRSELLNRQNIVTAGLRQQGLKELTRRQLEQENIKAWRDIRLTQIQTASQQAAAVAAAAYYSQLPNPQIMNAYTEAIKGSMLPLPALK